MATNKTPAETLKSLLADIDAMRAGGDSFGPFALTELDARAGAIIEWPNLSLLAREGAAMLDGRTVVVRMPSADEARRFADAIMVGAIRRREESGQLTGAMLGILRDRAALAESVTII